MCLPLFLLIANPLTQAVAAKETSSAIIQTLDIFLFVLLLFILNQLVISLNDTWTKLIYGLALGLILLIFYLALPGSVSLIKIPFRALSLGNIQHAQIIVTKSTCDYTNAINPSLCKLDKFNTFGLIDDIDISSNIGSEFIIRNSVNQQIFIKKKSILSWSITEPKK